jgi:TolB protein
MMKPIAALAVALCAAFSAPASVAQTPPADGPGPLRIVIDQGVREPVPFAAPQFIALDDAALEFADPITRVMVSNLVSTGLFREIPRQAHISQVGSISAPPAFADWQAINAQGLIVGEASTTADGLLQVDFRLFDVFMQREIGDGVRFTAPPEDWRRIAHKVSDEVYGRLTGEGPYFDSRIAFVSESGPKNARVKRISIMDQDGANVRNLTGGAELVLAPRWSPNGRDILYTSYTDGIPRIYLLDADTGQRERLDSLPGMTFAPRWSPDGSRVIFSAAQNGNTDLYVTDLATRQRLRLTRSPAIDTAGSFSPDGREIVFESDRGGSQQIYTMNADGTNVQRVSFGQGRYGTPVWSPRGDKFAFTKMVGGRFHIGVMDRDGTNERLLTASFLDEGPTWSPNGRVLMFFRETPGPLGAASVVSVDVTGQNLKYVNTPGPASDPSWSPVRQD